MHKIEANFWGGKRQHTIFNCFTSAIGISHHRDLTPEHTLVLPGGADISPSLYNKPKSAFGHGMIQPSSRDLEEWNAIEHAVKMGVPIVGICRGAQLLCAFAGGSLVQHIDGHIGSDHLIRDRDDNYSLYANSCHHQMMVPPENAEILAKSMEPVMGRDDNDNPTSFDYVPEVVYFPNINALGIQGHPEWMIGKPFNHYCSSLIKKYLLKE